MCARGGALCLWWGPKEPLATKEAPLSEPPGVWRADEETEGAFDGWNHLDFVEKRPAHKGDFAVCPPSPKTEVGDAFSRRQGRAALLDGRRAASTSTKWLRGPHDEEAHP